MKIELTENQVKNLIRSLNEQTDNFDFEKEAPNLSKFMSLFKTMTNDGNNVNPDVNDPGFNNDITAKTLSNKGKVEPKTSSGLKLMHPLGRKLRITSLFGKRNINVSGATKNHKGVDISTPSGSPVYAPANGTVLFAGDTTPNGCGGFIKLDHGNLQTKFCHLKKWVVNGGQQVKMGQIIGYTGGGKMDPYRGTASGPHLHYEILNSSGIAMNPLQVQSNLV